MQSDINIELIATKLHSPSSYLIFEENIITDRESQTQNTIMIGYGFSDYKI